MARKISSGTFNLQAWRRIGLATAIAVRVEQDVDTRDIQTQDIRHTDGEVSHWLG